MHHLFNTQKRIDISSNLYLFPNTFTLSYSLRGISSDFEEELIERDSLLKIESLNITSNTVLAQDISNCILYQR